MIHKHALVCGGPTPCCKIQHLRSLCFQKTMWGRPTQYASKTGVGTTERFLCYIAQLSLRLKTIVGTTGLFGHDDLHRKEKKRVTIKWGFGKWECVYN